MNNPEVKPYIYPELNREQILIRRRELCDELEEVTAQLSGQLIELAMECARLRITLHQIYGVAVQGQEPDRNQDVYLDEVERLAEKALAGEEV
jgi:hypothetical protein